MSDYEVLGIKPGADAAEIKRAYFALVRKYPPDRDPDMFKKVRAAYENLQSSGGEESEAGFEMAAPNNMLMRYYFDEMIRDRRWEDEEESVKHAKRMVDMFPGEPSFQRYYAYCAFENENYGVAAREAGQLYEDFPSQLEYLSMYAKSCHRRGWNKKALPLFVQGMKLGIRGVSFELDYAQTLHELGKRDEALEVLLSMLRRPRKWTEKKVEPLGKAFEYLSQLLAEHRKPSQKDQKRIADSVDLLAKGVSANRQVVESEDEIYTFAAAGRTMVRLLANTDAYVDAAEAFLKAFEKSRDYLVNKITSEIRDTIAGAVLARSSELPEHVREVLMKLDQVLEGGNRNAFRLEFGLCLLQDTGNDREKIARISKVIEDANWRAYSIVRNVFTAIDGVPDLEKLKRNLLQHYVGEKYLGVFVIYANAFPEEVSRAQPGVSYANIRRNDPCPCGSGRKFKQCCIDVEEFTKAILNGR